MGHARNELNRLGALFSAFTKPNNDGNGFGVNGLHEFDLVVLLMYITLIDTQSIDPKFHPSFCVRKPPDSL
jgi:hypothetical protein